MQAVQYSSTDTSVTDNMYPISLKVRLNGIYVPQSTNVS